MVKHNTGQFSFYGTLKLIVYGNSRMPSIPYHLIFLFSRACNEKQLRHDTVQLTDLQNGFGQTRFLKCLL